MNFFFIIWFLSSLVFSQRFFVISDVHLDVHYNSSYDTSFHCHSTRHVESSYIPTPTNNSKIYGRLGCDSPKSLLKSALEEMRLIDPSPDFLVLLGDSVSHYAMHLLNNENEIDVNYNKYLVRQTIVDLTNLVEEFFPETQIIQAIGNNDGYERYQAPSGREGAEYLEFLYELWKPSAIEISGSFYDGGYYRSFTGSGYHILALNTNYLSSQSERKEESLEQLEWLRDEVEESDGDVIILLHIPPGFSMYDGGEQGWHEDYSKIFFDIVENNARKIKYILSGHRHLGSFKVIPNATVPFIVNPAISPIFFNNPSFRYFNESDYTDFIFNLYDEAPKWKKEYSFKEFFNLEGLDFIQAYLELESDDDLLEKFLSHSRGLSNVKTLSRDQLWTIETGGNHTEIPDTLRRVVLCSMKTFDQVHFNLCKNNENI
ncbi:unnamed protein product [Blepharisma stoltei]|uniref:Calcineurin-like phosphoesterase domain-containing protein n=1 Tax=Blepharisma stoltei TaxID=1481888 RepID=A0AAU9IJV0_9CILI|nr:unnamed protein product [Blepharisma stoltei]